MKTKNSKTEKKPSIPKNNNFSRDTYFGYLHGLPENITENEILTALKKWGVISVQLKKSIDNIIGVVVFDQFSNFMAALLQQTIIIKDNLINFSEDFVDIPCVVYLHGLTEDINEKDIFTALHAWCAISVQIKKSLDNNIIGRVRFEHHVDLIAAIQQQPIKVKDHNIVISLSEDIVHFPINCYLHGLTKDINEIDIFTALEVWDVISVQIKKSLDNIIGVVGFDNYTNLILAVKEELIQIKGHIVVVSLAENVVNISINGFSAADYVNSIPHEDEHNNKNIKTDVDKNKKENDSKIKNNQTKEKKSIESIQPIQDFLKESSVPFHPPYKFCLYNLPKEIIKDEIIKLFDTYSGITVCFSKYKNIAYINFKSRGDLLSVIYNLQHGKIFEIRNHRIMLSLNDTELLKYEPSNKLPSASTVKDVPSSVNVPTKQSGRIKKTTIVSIDQQKIPTNSPFKLYLFNNFPNIPKNIVINMISDHLELMNLDVIKVEYLTNCYSVEFTKRSDLIIAIKKNNFFIEGKQLTISIFPKITQVLSNSSVKMANNISAKNNEANQFQRNPPNKNHQQKSNNTGIISLNEELAKLAAKEPYNTNKSVNHCDRSSSNAKSENLPTQQQKSSRSRRQRGRKNAQTAIYEKIENPWNNLQTPKLTYECIRCKKQSNLTCSNCGKFYCSSVCQKNDWNMHKNYCRLPELIPPEEFHEKLKKKLNYKNEKLNNIDKKTDIELKSNVLLSEDDKDANQLNTKIEPIKQNSTNKEDSQNISLKMNEDKNVIGTTLNPIKQATPMMSYSDMPKSGASVFITYVLDGITVFIRSADPEPDSDYKRNLNEIAEYVKFHAPPPIENPMTGQIILAPLKGNLERALILKHKGNYIAVAFIEFGNIELVSVDVCHQLNNDLKLRKRFVHKCIIDLASEFRMNDRSKGILESYKGVKLNLIYKLPYSNSTVVDLINPRNGTSFINLIEKFVN